MPNRITYGNLPHDVIFNVGEQEFGAQQMFLSAVCKGFHALLLGDQRNQGPKRITMPDTCPLAFKRLLDGIYNHHFCDASEFLTTTTQRRDREKRESETHIELVNKKIYVEHFWKSVGRLTELAHRFNAGPVEDSIYATLRLDSCFVDNCFVCYNQVVCAATHHYHIPQCEKSYSDEIREELHAILRELEIKFTIPAVSA